MSTGFPTTPGQKNTSTMDEALEPLARAEEALREAEAASLDVQVEAARVALVEIDAAKTLLKRFLRRPRQNEEN